jgi:GNAT superfamily N-acetyltransferase
MDRDSQAVATLVDACIAEIAQGRGGRRLVHDIAARFGLSGPDLVTSMAEEISTSGVVTAEGCAGVLDGLVFIYVKPEHRRKGHGSALYARVAAGRNVDLFARPGDRAVKSFGESLGLKARLLIMSAESSEDDGER